MEHQDQGCRTSTFGVLKRTQGRERGSPKLYLARWVAEPAVRKVSPLALPHTYIPLPVSQSLICVSRIPGMDPTTYLHLGLTYCLTRTACRYAFDTFGASKEPGSVSHLVTCCLPWERHRRRYATTGIDRTGIRRCLQWRCPGSSTPYPTEYPDCWYDLSFCHRPVDKSEALTMNWGPDTMRVQAMTLPAHVLGAA